jgi:hypothetical protein
MVVSLVPPSPLPASLVFYTIHKHNYNSSAVIVQLTIQPMRTYNNFLSPS